ncbi:MAG: hypothetical protein ACE5FZ_08930, partial [Nitrospiria bacterium]
MLALLQVLIGDGQGLRAASPAAGCGSPDVGPAGLGDPWPAANLSAAKTVDIPTPDEGDLITYTI